MPNDVTKDLEAMNKVFDMNPEPGVPDFKTDPPGTDEPGTTAPSTKEPSTDTPDTTAPGTVVPETPAPTTEVPAEDPRDAEIRSMRAEIEELKRSKRTTKAPKTDAPSTDAPISEEDFLGDVDLDELSRDPAQFKKVLNSVYAKAIQTVRAEMKKADELVMRSMPGIVKHNIALETELKNMKDNFFKENKDLEPWAKVVANVFEELGSANPDKRYDEILPDVAREVRSRLNLPTPDKSNNNNNNNSTPPPRKNKRGQRQNQRPELSQMEQELDAMDKALGH